MARVRLAIFVWGTVFALRVDGSIVLSLVFGWLLVVLLDQAIATGRAIQRTWRHWR